MKYTFKPLPELYWGVVTAASIVILTALFTLQPEAVTDWRAWGIALGGGAVRAAAGAGLDYLRRSVVEGDPDADLTAAVEALPLSERLALAEHLANRAAARERA